MKLSDYIKGDRKGKDAHRLELEAMSDPLLADALEGFDSVHGDHEQALGRLRGRLVSRTGRARRKKRQSHRTWVYAAAVILLCLVAGSGLWLLRELGDASGPLATETAREQIQEVEIPALVADTLHEIQHEDLQMEAEAPQAMTVISDVIQVVNSQEMVYSDFSEDFAFTENAVEESAIAEESAAEAKSHSARTSQRQAVQKSAGGGVVSGRVTDMNGQPLAGAVILGKGTQSGTSTDMNGHFSFTINDFAAGIEVRHIGYVPALISGLVPGQYVDISLKQASTSIEEVVVTGYHKVEKASYTGSIVTVKANDTVSGGRETKRGRKHAESASRSDAKEASTTTDSLALTQSFSKYVKDNLPQGVSGRVVLEFSGNKKGRPVDITVVESTGRAAEREARRLLRQSTIVWPQSKMRVAADFGRSE